MSALGQTRPFGDVRLASKTHRRSGHSSSAVRCQLQKYSLAKVCTDPDTPQMVWSQPGFIPLALITAMADGLVRYATSALAASGSLLLAATPTA